MTKFAALVSVGLGLAAPQAMALGVNATLFCANYPESSLCVNGRAACTTCHDGAPPALNLFGMDVKAEISTRPGYSKVAADFERYLADVLGVIADRDSDGDGFKNSYEIASGHAPGDSLDFPQPEDPGIYDPALALRRLSILYCGTSPSYDAMKSLDAAADKKSLLHTTLDKCLASSFWLNDALPRLADDKIRPVGSLGGTGREALVGDFNYDYRLFVHAMSGDQDARDLLTADYHVAADGSVVRGVIQGRGGQPLEPARRAGLITTQWFIGNNTMFALLPRNTAAQAYRAYLGLDIARSEGLHPIDGEPRDPDHMGVHAPDCAVCHSTLDPLACPFTPYLAFASRRLDGQPRPRGVPLGGYDPTATAYQDGYLLGSPVHDLLEWARLAANSDEFKKTLAGGLYRHAVGHDPQTTVEREEFARLWLALPEDGYSANRLIHRLVDTRSFGSPGSVARPNAVWKRQKQIARDLARALELDLMRVCQEVGTYDCADQVFLTTLGGNDPVNKSQYRPATTPGLTTPVALERFVLSACSQRATLDAAGNPVVFRFFDLSKPSLVGDDDGVDAEIQDLYRRLHGRDPEAAEIQAVRDLMTTEAGPTPALEFAKLACLVIGSSQEFLFQ